METSRGRGAEVLDDPSAPMKLAVEGLSLILAGPLGRPRVVNPKEATSSVLLLAGDADLRAGFLSFARASVLIKVVLLAAKKIPIRKSAFRCLLLYRQSLLSLIGVTFWFWRLKSTFMLGSLARVKLKSFEAGEIVFVYEIEDDPFAEHLRQNSAFPEVLSIL